MKKPWLDYKTYKKSPLPWWRRLTEKQGKEIYDHVVGLCGATVTPENYNEDKLDSPSAFGLVKFVQEYLQRNEVDETELSWLLWATFNLGFMEGMTFVEGLGVELEIKQKEYTYEVAIKDEPCE